MFVLIESCLLIKWIMRPHLFRDFLVVLTGGGEFRGLLLRLSSVATLTYAQYVVSLG